MGHRFSKRSMDRAREVDPLLMAVAVLALTLAAGCACSIQVLAPREGCSSLITTRWEDLPSAVLEPGDDTALDRQLFGIAQTGQLRIANRDKADALETIRRCEARDAQAVE